MNVFITKVEKIESSQDHISFYHRDELPFFLEDENPGDEPMSMTVATENITADYYVVNSGRKYKFGFSDQVRKTLWPLFSLIRDQGKRIIKLEKINRELQTDLIMLHKKKREELKNTFNKE